MPRKTKICPIIELVETDEVFLDVTPNIIPGVYDFYRISNYGRVFSKYIDRVMKPGINGGGYYFVELHTINGPVPVMIHRMEMLTFHPISNPELFDVNHEDGNKLNNILSNLSWTTHSENILHAYNNGLHPKENDSVLSIINDSTATKICELLQTGMYTNKEIADMAGNNATANIVADIKGGATWKSISSNYDFNYRTYKIFNEDIIRMVCKYFSENTKPETITVNEHCRNAMRYLGLNFDENMIDSLRKVYNRKYYTDISKDYDF